MFFKQLIRSWAGADPESEAGVTSLANDLGIPAKNVRRWVDLDSIPADWFAPVARAARKRRITGADERSLAAIAEQRRIARSEAA